MDDFWILPTVLVEIADRLGRDPVEGTRRRGSGEIKSSLSPLYPLLYPLEPQKEKRKEERKEQSRGLMG